MEKQLFDWTGWDQQDTASFTFYNIVTKVHISGIIPGTKFDCALVDYQNGILVFYDKKGDELYKFSLLLIVKI